MAYRNLVIAFILLLPASALAEDPSHSSGHPPLWAKQAIWYQIFPERFRNGDSTNDPTLKDIAGSWPHDTPAEWHVSPWTSDWYKPQPWEKSDSQGFYHFVQRRRYGGDLQGIIDKLGYLADLGVNAIYVTPLFESPSLHKYDATMYHHIDNNFGHNPEGDRKIWSQENPADPSTWKWTSADGLFLKLLREAHKRKIKVIIDGVFNHVGMTFWAFEDVRKRQQASPYKDWFTITKWDDPATPEDEFEYKGWFGVKELPELRKDSTGMAKVPGDHIHAIVRRWMDPNGDGNPADGIDGWRLDVADMVPIPFWKEFRTWVRKINPNAYITGEVWWQDWKNDKMFNAAPWLQGDVFDGVMNYRWAREMCRFFMDDTQRISASEFIGRLDSLRRDYPQDATSVLMNLMDSHDTDRLSSHIINPNLAYDHNVGVNDNRDYRVRKPNPDEVRLQKLIALFQMTYVGAPMIYYGDEAGMWGADDPDERKPMLWQDLTYEDEASHPFGAPRRPDRNQFDNDLYQYYKKLIHLRREHPALSLGSFSTIFTDDKHDTFAFKRSTASEEITVIINNSRALQQCSIPLSKGISASGLTNILDTKTFTVKRGNLNISLSPKSGVVLVSRFR